jgi:hypothetical protein
MAVCAADRRVCTAARCSGVMELPEPGPGAFRAQIVHDGTRAGSISAALQYLTTAPANVISLSFVLNNELITLNADMARAAAWKGAAPIVHAAGRA